MYGFQTAKLTDLSTNEVTEKSFDDILNNEFMEWHNLFSFQVLIRQDTKYLCIDGRYFALDEGLAYEVIGDNALQIHFPHWAGYDCKVYNIVITLCWQQLYG